MPSLTWARIPQFDSAALLTSEPTYLYKLVYDPATQKSWAHWQQNREGETVGRPITYSELVKRTGIVFLPMLHPRP